MLEREVLCDSVDGADSEGGGDFFAAAASAPSSCTPSPGSREG